MMGQEGFRELTFDMLELVSKGKSTESLLEQQGRLLDGLLAARSECIFVTNHLGQFTHVNQQGATAIGHSIQELIGKNWREINLPAGVTARLGAKVEWVIRTGQTYTDVQYGFLSSNCRCEYSIAPIYDDSGALEAIITTVRDISGYVDGKSQWEERFALAFDNNPCPMCISSLEDEVILDVNKSFEKVIGYNRDEVIGYNYLDLNLYGPYTTFRKALSVAIAEKGSIEKFELTFPKKNGELISLLVSVEVVEMKGKKYTLNTFEDITDRKRMVNSLLESERRFFKIFRSFPDMMGILDLQSKKWLDVNDAFIRCFGFTHEEINQFRISRLITCPKLRNKLLTDFYHQKKIENCEVCCRTKTGKKVFILLSTELIELGGNLCCLLSAKDITALKQLDKEISRLDRLHLIGQMSKSIGHEIRNPLTSIKGFLQLLDRQEQDSKKRNYYEIMINDVDKANSIITEFLYLAQDKARKTTLKDLQQILSSLQPLMLAAAIEQDKQLVMETEPMPPLIIDDKEICQLIYNLVHNGLEAMSPGGTITIKTYMENNKAVIMINDQGCGIEAALTDKIGNPFLTTKQDRLGLGLAVCYSIANRNQAAIDFTTGPHGTTFFVRFDIPKVTKMW